jgi:hypothetical protein
MDVRSNEIIKFIKYSVNYFDEEMSFLVFQSGTHQQRKNLVEKWPRSKFFGVNCDLP